MGLLTYIVKGRATIVSGSLRCAANRQDGSGKKCNKLICRSNDISQIAGSFKCDRCDQMIFVELKEARKDLIKDSRNLTERLIKE